MGKDRLPLDQAARFAVFKQRRIQLSSGDRIRITRNGDTAVGKHRLNNGDLFTVKGFADNGNVVLENGWEVPKDYGHVSYGLVVTSHASQGKTFDRVLVGQSSQSFPASSREQFYVSVSRGREQVLVFTDNKEELLDAVSHSEERLSGTELIEGLDPIRHHVIRERLNEQQRETPAAVSAQVAKRLGQSPATVSRTLTVLKLPEALRAQVANGKIPADAAYLLARVEEPQRQSELAAEVVGGKLSRDALTRKMKRVRRAEAQAESGPNRITALLGGGRSITVGGKGLTLDSLMEALEQLLSRARKSKSQGLSLTTFVRTLRDQAAS